MRGDNISRMVCGYARSTNDQWDVNVFLISTRFSRLKAMLADVESVIAAVHDVSVVHDSVGFETFEKTVDHFIDCLESS